MPLKFLLKYVNAKFWGIIKVKLQGSKVKHIRPYHGCHVSNISALLACSARSFDCLWFYLTFSDCTVRVFTSDPERMASEDVLKVRFLQYDE